MSTSIALVTGANSGIGVHIARQLADQGWTVLVGARDAARGSEAAAQFGGRPLLLDVTDADTIAAAAAAAAVPNLDVLVNNAGISLDAAALVTETDLEAFRRTYEINVFGVVAVTNAFLRALRRSSHPRIVNVSSGTGSLTWSTGPNPQFAIRSSTTKRPGPAPVPHTVRRRPHSRYKLQDGTPLEDGTSSHDGIDQPTGPGVRTRRTASAPTSSQIPTTCEQKRLVRTVAPTRHPLLYFLIES